MKRAILVAVWSILAIAQTPPTGSLEGSATNPIDGKPLANVHVHLRLVTEPDAKYGAVTTAEGRFSFASVAPGAYALSAERTGYVPPDVVIVTVKPDDRKRDVELKMMPGAVLSGRVVNERGDPMQDIYVQALRGETSYSSITNDDGEFRMAPIRPGKYLLLAADRSLPSSPEVRSDGTKEVNYGPTYYPGVATVSQAISVEAKAGAEIGGLEIRLVPQPILHISGRVTGGGKNTNSFVFAGDASGARVHEDGTFVLWRVPPGQHFISAESRSPGGNWRSAPVEVTVGDTSVENVDLAIVEPFALTGRVESWSGGAGNLHLHMLARPTDDDLISDIAADGTFHTELLSPGFYRVTIASLPATTYLKRLRLGPRDMPDGVLDLRGNPGPDQLSIELGTNGATLSGTVQSANGPAVDALVALFPVGHYARERRILIHAGSNGAYSIRGLPPGKYAILALPAMEPTGLAVYDEKLETVDLSEGDTLQHDVKVTTGR